MMGYYLLDYILGARHLPRFLFFFFQNQKKEKKSETN